MSKTIFCPKCHREAYRIIEEGETIKVVQSRRTLLSVNQTSTVSMSINCPHGHPVKLELKPKEAIE